MRRGSEKVVRVTFEIHLDSDHFFALHHLSPTQHLLSPVCMLQAPSSTLVSAAQKPEEACKDKSKTMLLVCSSSPYHLRGNPESLLWPARPSMVCLPFPILLKISSPSLSSLLLTQLQPDWASGCSLNNPRTLPLAGPLHLLYTPSFLAVSAQISLSRETFPVHLSKVTVPSPPFLLPSYCALFFFLAHLASWQIAYFHILCLPA